jgi:hypothetical protein
VPPYCGAVLKRLGLDLDKEKSVGAIECTGCNIWGASGQKFHFLDYHAERGRWQQVGGCGSPNLRRTFAF